MTDDKPHVCTTSGTVSAPWFHFWAGWKGELPAFFVIDQVELREMSEHEPQVLYLRHYELEDKSNCTLAPSVEGEWNWSLFRIGPSQERFFMHNSDYEVIVRWRYWVSMKGERGPYQTSIRVNVKNLVVTSQDVGKVLRWDFERGIRDTSFSYKIECAQRKEVEVRIYDMEGNLVYEKRERKICPATYSFTWDGTVNTGYLLDSLLECCCSPYYCCEGYDYSEGYEGGWGYEEGYGEGYDGAEGYEYTGECGEDEYGEGEYGEGCEFSCGCCEGYEGEVGYDYSEDQTQFCYGNFQGGDEGLVCEDEVSQCGEGYDGDGGNIAPCGLIAPSGLYTFDVEVEFIPYDRDTVRSERMEVIAGPIEYLGYDDGGTPDDEEDDNYLYFLRVYTLRSYRNSRYGEIWLYGPELDMVWRWEVSVLRCVEHEGCKGLTANPGGERHGVIIPVPVKVMEKVGTYRFVLHFYDDYGDSYKDHEPKPALEVNQRAVPLPPIVYISGNYRGVTWHGAWCHMPSHVHKATRYLSQSQTVIQWAINNTPRGSGIVRASVNGGFFHVGTRNIVGHVGTGNGWPGNNMLIRRWNFGMGDTGTSRFIERMVLQSGTRSTYTLHPNVRNFPYGFSGIGVLIWGGRARNLDDDDDGDIDEDGQESGGDSSQVDNDNDGRFNEDPHWPDSGSDRARTAIAWDNRGHFYLIVFEGDGNRGVTWQETVNFFQNELPRWMRDVLPSFVRNEPAYEGASVSPQVITIQDAIMLDGGGSTQFIWIWAQRRRQQDGSWVDRIRRYYAGQGREVPTLLEASAQAP